MLCEFHIPISATPDFVRRIHYLAGSIALYGGLRPDDYRIVVTMGDRGTLDPSRDCPWSRAYPITWRWADERGESIRYAAQWCQRYAGPFVAETVVLLDADILVTGSLLEVITQARGTARFMAAPANYSPFYLHPEHLDVASPTEWWQRLFDQAGLPMPAFDMEHRGWNLMQAHVTRYADQLRFSPPYPNAGVVIASARTMAAIGKTIRSELEGVVRLTNTLLSGQIALTLSMVRHGLEWTPLPITYNFMNLPELFDGDPAAARDIRALHYMMPGEVDRQADFMTDEAVEALLQRPGLSPVNRFLVDRLSAVHTACVEPALRAASRPGPPAPPAPMATPPAPSVRTMLTDDLNALVASRVLIGTLVGTQLKLRYHRSALGAAWTLFNPLLLLTVQALAFSQILGMDIRTYAVYLMSGLIPWQFFATSIEQASRSLIANEALIRVMPTPKFIFPLSDVLVAQVHAGFSLVAFVIVATAIGAPFFPQFVLLPVVLTLFAAFTFGLTLVAMTLMTLFRDVAHIITVVLSAYYFASPILYPPLSVGPLAALLRYNPMTYYLELFHCALVSASVFHPGSPGGGAWPSMHTWLVATGCAVLSLVAGYAAYKTYEDEFIFHL